MIVEASIAALKVMVMGAFGMVPVESGAGVAATTVGAVVPGTTGSGVEELLLPQPASVRRTAHRMNRNVDTPFFFAIEGPLSKIRTANCFKRGFATNVPMNSMRKIGVLAGKEKQGDISK